MRVAAYQAPLLRPGFVEALALIRARVDWCEAEGIEILCCPEAILGGLADYALDPTEFAIDARGDQLACILAPLASDTVTTIVGFTEIADKGRLYNSAAVFHKGSVLGLYRKLYPAINRSVYDPGDQMPIFHVGDLTFGIVICNDSNYLEPARIMAVRGATTLFVPTNTALSPEKTYADLAVHARNCDIARAVEYSMWVIRADVAGQLSSLTSAAASGIVDPDGMVRQGAERSSELVLVADIDTTARERRRGWDAGRNRAVIDEYTRLLGGL
jgi:predicted amidohydrolase